MIQVSEENDSKHQASESDYDDYDHESTEWKVTGVKKNDGLRKIEHKSSKDERVFFETKKFESGKQYPNKVQNGNEEELKSNQEHEVRQDKETKVPQAEQTLEQSSVILFSPPS